MGDQIEKPLFPLRKRVVRKPQRNLPMLVAGFVGIIVVAMVLEIPKRSAKPSTPASIDFEFQGIRIGDQVTEKLAAAFDKTTWAPNDQFNRRIEILDGSKGIDLTVYALDSRVESNRHEVCP